MTSEGWQVYEYRPPSKEEIEQNERDRIKEATVVFGSRCRYGPADAMSEKSILGCMAIRRPNMTLEFQSDRSRTPLFEILLAQTTIKKVAGPMTVRRRHRSLVSQLNGPASPDPVLPRPEVHVMHGDKIHVFYVYDEKGRDEIYDALERAKQGVDELSEELSKTEIKT